MPTEPLVYRSAPYVPTVPRSGSEGLSLFRLKNMILRGRADRPYLEAYRGEEDLSETIATQALTGTVAFASGSKTVTGTGTLFKTELMPGQAILCISGSNTYYGVVEEIATNTSLTLTSAIGATVSGLTANILPVIFELNKKRATLVRGNALQFDKGTILAVGQGTLRLNGSVLAGTSLSLTTRQPKLAIYDPATGNYSVYSLGMSTPGAHTLAAVAGTGKNMQGGTYSVVLVPYRAATLGYNDAGLPVTVTIATGQAIEVTPPAASSNGADGWIAFATRYQRAAIEATQGPWFKAMVVPVSALSGGKFILEYLDAEIEVNEKLTFNNDAPVDAAFVASVAGYPIYLSCQGPEGSAPGPVVVPAKPRNIDAAPLDSALPLSPPETILGFVAAVGRIYLLTPNTLQILQSTGRNDFPIATRPFWRTGFKNPSQLVFVGGTLYGISLAGPTRSIADGDEGSEEHGWAADIGELIRTWDLGRALVAHDPLNEAVCFIYPAAGLNSDGYQTTRVLLWGLRQNTWIGDVTLSRQTSDMIVSDARTVNGRLALLAGGRTNAGTVVVKTYHFDAGSGQAISGYAAWQYTDAGAESRTKTIKHPRVTGRLQSATLGIHGADVSESIAISNIEADSGNASSKSGALALTTTAQVTQSQRLAARVSNLAVFAPKIEWSWDGSGEPIRIDELTLEVIIQGARR
jgi:hypothetical protein